MNKGTIALGLSGRKLTNKDTFSKSDPYVVLSRTLPNSGWFPIRTSETKMNNLNPDWSEFLIYENELPQDNPDIKLEVFDDDGKKGPGVEDDSIGVGYFTLTKLEEACKTQTPLPIADKKRGKNAGMILVRSFRANGGGQGQGLGAYPAQQVPGVHTNTTPGYSGYPPPSSASVLNQTQAGTGYPPPSNASVLNLPQAGTGYPPPSNASVLNLPQAGTGYPPPSNARVPYLTQAGTGYPPESGTGYPPPSHASVPYPPEAATGDGYAGGFSGLQNVAAHNLGLNNSTSAGGFTYPSM